MAKIRKKAIASILAGTMLLGSISGLMVTEGTKIVHAESKALSDAKAKISHLTKSLKENYLGLKNQATWQLYISQARTLIKNIPSSEKWAKDTLTAELDKDEALVNSLARINHVEKSIAPVESGGYGNYLGIKNAETWREYLELAVVDLEKVDKNIFKKQYDELINRMNVVDLTVKGIEDAYSVEYNKVKALFDEAKRIEKEDLDVSLAKAKEALDLSQILGSCTKTTEIVAEINKFLYATPREMILTEKSYKVGKDIAPGRYVFTAFGEESKIFDNDLLNFDKKDKVGIYSYTTDLIQGEILSDSSISGTVKMTPVMDRTKSNELTTGAGWEVGVDIDPGNYIVSILPEFEKNISSRWIYKPEFHLIRDRSSVINTSYSKELSEWTKSELKTFVVTLVKGDKIRIENVPSLKFTKKVG